MVRTQSPHQRSFFGRVVDLLGLDIDNLDGDTRPVTPSPVWEARAKELLVCAQLMQSGGIPDTAGELSFVCAHERVFLVLPRSELVEPQIVAGDWQSPDEAVSFRSVAGTGYTHLVADTAAVERGTVTITNLRVVFQGATTARHWLFDELDGVMRDRSAPITYLRVADQERPSGVLYHPAAAEVFRLRLATALAWATGDPAPFAPLLQAEIDAHMARRLVLPH